MSGISIKYKKVIQNPIFQRTQCIIDVYHSGKHYGKLEDLKAQVAQKFKVDAKCVILYGFQSRIGGEMSTGFCCAYKNMEALKVAEPEFRQIRVGIKDKKKPISRKQIKTANNKAIKKFGTHAKKSATDKKKK